MINLKEILPDYTSITYYFLILFALIYFGFSLSLMRQAKQKQIKNYWASYLPIISLWILGKVIRTFRIGTKEFNNAEYRLITSSIVFILTANVPIIGILVGVAYVILVTSCMKEFANQTIAYQATK